ncbi:hypothetical protein [Streptantibioticus ferralitis]|uniref:Uncharacterized protein n=1 Tax=Streptantibioticus ferralitis TaxID=236510 RepID=A0ABT5Z8D0_9ACTN|nr:hypothetical protein [Streptantibioticus ferralitis]MDF2260076.1 hypothetical protein [Streptantibioticus ferralitis]
MTRRNRSLYRGAALGMAAAAVALLTSCTQNSSTANSSSPNAAQTPSSSAVASPAVGTSARHTAVGSSAKAGGCRSLPASPTVKASVTAAYRRQAQPPLAHIAPVKGTFYYGSCDGVFYAGTRVQLTPGSTEAEQVALQDDGAAMKYFVDRPGAGWRYVASDSFPAGPRGCAAIAQIPARLAALWNDCRSAAGQE